MKKRNLSDRAIMLFMYTVFAVFSVFCALHLSIPLVLDETGTMANTAFLAGDDWSICAQSMGGFYYKPGQAILYLPIYLIFRDNPFMMYKFLMVFNMLFISLIPVIAYYICRNYFKINSQIKAVLLAVSSGGLSSLWLYSIYSRSDMMLILLPWVLLLILLELLDAVDTSNRKKHGLLTLCLSFISVYAYMCHSRGLILLIATFLTVLAATFIYKKKIVNYLIYIPATTIFLIVDKIVSGYFKNGIYGVYGTRHASIESFDFEKFMKIFTAEGFVTEIKLCIGWIFNMVTSSMGLIIIAFVAALVIIYKYLKKEEGTVQENIFSLFSILCLLGSFALGALFFFPHVLDLTTGVDLIRSDRMLYGRYTVGAVGPMCLLALYTLTCKQEQMIKLRTKVISVGIYIVTLALFITKVAPLATNKPMTNLRYFISIAGFVNVRNNQTSAAFPDLTTALLKAGIAALIVMIIILVLTSVRKKKIVFSTCIIVVALSFINFNHMFYNYRNSRDDLVAEKTKNIICNNIKGIDEISQKYPAVFKSNSGYAVKFYQFGLPKFNVGSLQYIKEYGYEDFLIICQKDNINKAINECSILYDDDNYYLFEDFDYKNARRDVLFVKGDDLANLLIKNGNKLILYEKN